MHNSLQILLIEDNPGDARLIQEMLKDSQLNNWKFLHASNLSTGLEIIQQGTMDVILLDLGLPDSQGLDSLVKITNQYQQLPVIVLTGLKNADTAIEAMQAGAQDYLLKGDFTNETLIRVIRYAIERKQVEAELQKSRQLLHEAESISHTGAWEWDLESGVLTMSDEWMRIHGADRRNYTTDDLTKIAHPDDVPTIHKAWNAVLDGHGEYNVEHRIIRQNDGQERIIQAYGKLFVTQEGHPKKLIGVASDITERKEIEKNLQAQEDKFKKFFNTNPSATFVWKALDGDFVLTESNQASLEMTSGKASDFLGLRASEIYGSSFHG